MQRCFIVQEIRNGNYEEVEKLLVNESKRNHKENNYSVSDEFAFCALKFKSIINRYKPHEKRDKIRVIEKDKEILRVNDSIIENKLNEAVGDARDVRDYFHRIVDCITPHCFLGIPMMR